MKEFLLLFLTVWGINSISLAQGQKILTLYEGRTITTLDAGSAFEIHLWKSDRPKVTLDIPVRWEDKLDYSLSEDGILMLRLKDGVRTKKGEKFVAEIYCPSLERIHLSGACKLNSESDFENEKMVLSISGASQVTMAGLLKTRDLDIEQRGAAKLLLNAEAVNTEIRVSSASALDLKGKSQVAGIVVSGASRVNMGEFAIQKMSLQLTGASRLNATVEEELTGNISGASKMTYNGNPKTDIQVTGAASFRKN